MDVVYLVVDFASGHIVSLVAPIPIIDQMNSFHIRLRAFNQDCEREREKRQNGGKHVTNQYIAGT